MLCPVNNLPHVRYHSLGQGLKNRNEILASEHPLFANKQGKGKQIRGEWGEDSNINYKLTRQAM